MTIPTPETRSRSTRNRLIASLAAAATVAAVTITGSTAAQAAVTGYSATVQYIGGGDYINIRSGPSRDSSVVARLAPGTPIAINCQTAGKRLGFSQYADNATWDQVSNGYVSDVLTTTPGGPRAAAPGGGYTAFSSGIPRCGAVSTRESRAADWARSQVGVVELSGLCETMVEAAYGTTGRYYDANADWAAQQGRLHGDTNPPPGALVFYDVAPNGHVGISLGGGMVVSTKSPVNGVAQPVRIHSVLGLGLTYRGWSAAPDGWPGR